MSRAAALVTAATGLALVAAAPSPAQAGHTLAQTGHTLAAGSADPDPFAPLLAALALAAWSLLSWVLLAAAAVSATRLPGLAGRVGGLIADGIAPAGVRRVIEVCFGLTVAVATIGAAPASAGPPLPPAPRPAAASLDWPTPPTPSTATPATPSAGARPSLDWNPAAPPRPAQTTAAVVGAVVVRTGDSLWAIAADHLPADAADARVARAWPAWWSANRAAVGPDPDLIHPGLRLNPPAQT